jgi:hypothetical protein
MATARKASSACDRRLAFDEVVNLEDLWLAGQLDPDVGKYGHQLIAKRLQLLSRVPDLADSQVVRRPEKNV